MQLIIDRLEAEWAVCEYREGVTLDLPLAVLPKDVKEGDVLLITVDRKATRERKAYADDLRNRMFRRNL